jgi:hypothetical protein
MQCKKLSVCSFNVKEVLKFDTKSIMKPPPPLISISFANRQQVLDTLICGMAGGQPFVWRNPSIMFVFAVRIVWMAWDGGGLNL